MTACGSRNCSAAPTRSCWTRIRSRRKTRTRSKEKYWAETPEERREKAVAVFLERHRQGRPSVRSQRKRQRVARDQRPEFFLSRLQRNPVGRQRRPHHVECQTKQPERHGARMAEPATGLRRQASPRSAPGTCSRTSSTPIAAACRSTPGGRDGRPRFQQRPVDLHRSTQHRNAALLGGHPVRSVYVLPHRRIHSSSTNPRVIYVGFGETDDWAHSGRYDLYLEAARQTDDYIRRLWELLQSMDQYAGKTALLMTTDHGRGDTIEDWKSHNAVIEGSERIWIAAMGPGVPAKGIVEELRRRRKAKSPRRVRHCSDSSSKANPKKPRPRSISDLGGTGSGRDRVLEDCRRKPLPGKCPYQRAYARKRDHVVGDAASCRFGLQTM
jgi:hypothetical protein